MEIKKCINCGTFITGSDCLCDSCKNKSTYDMTLLKDYFGGTQSFDSISAISAATGVSPVAIQKYMKENNYTDSSIDPISFTSIQY